jgi:hypothetical protein
VFLSDFVEQNNSTYHKIKKYYYFYILYDRLRYDMSKSTWSTHLTRKLEGHMKIVGEQIKLARLRRNLSRAQVAERAMCSELTEARVEKGSPTVAIGTYLRILYALQLEDDILLIAKDDPLGQQLQDIALLRKRASKK